MTSFGIDGDIRQSKHHDSSVKHVSGRAVYVDDMATPANCLTVLIGQSSYAYAKITRMDLSAVAEAPGIIAVMTAADIPGAND